MERGTIGGRENISQKEGGRERGKEGKEGERESRVRNRPREIKLEMRDNKREKGRREIQRWR